MKKVGGFIKKNKKRIIVISVFLCLFLFFLGFVFWYGVRLGLISVPKFGVLWYFNSNRETFDYIAEYVEENPEKTMDFVYPDSEKFMNIGDEKLWDSVEKMLKIGIFGRVSYYPSDNEGDREIIFQLSNLNVSGGNGIAIVYSNRAKQVEYGGVDDSERYEYEHIDGNWYYKYRAR